MIKYKFLKASIFASTIALANTAIATNGFLSHCSGPINCGTAGAGSAYSSSGIDNQINPALGARGEDHIIASAGIFHPVRTLDTSKAPLGNPIGKQTSKNENFLDVAFGGSYALSNDLALTVSLVGTGGMATKYNSPRTNPLFQINAPFDSKILYRLAHLNTGLAWQMHDKFSVGATIIWGYSDIKTDFAKQQGQFLAQTTGQGKKDSSLGYGARIGALWDAHEAISMAASYSSPVKFEKFKKYNDILFSSLDTPANATIGTKVKLAENTTLLADIKHIFYSNVKLIGRSPDQGGFGWKDQTVYMAGIRHKFSLLEMSLGYSYGRSPVRDKVVFANGLVPAVVEQHITAGMLYNLSNTVDIIASGFYAPKKTITDNGNGGLFSTLGKGSEVSMYQFGGLIGAKWKM